MDQHHVHVRLCYIHSMDININRRLGLALGRPLPISPTISSCKWIPKQQWSSRSVVISQIQHTKRNPFRSSTFDTIAQNTSKILWQTRPSGVQSNGCHFATRLSVQFPALADSNSNASTYKKRNPCLDFHVNAYFCCVQLLHSSRNIRFTWSKSIPFQKKSHRASCTNIYGRNHMDGYLYVAKR